jgi:hypothetical protein
MVSFSAREWSSVKTSKFRAALGGDFFSALGLDDTDGGNVTSVIGGWNGGGIDVIYDSDGSVMNDFFGLPAQYVLGITNIDYVEADTPEILEAWMVLSGPGIHPTDPNGIGFQGVVTHEMGHALNLGHSQANGAVWNPSVYDSPQPQVMRRALTGDRTPARSRPCTRSAPRSRETPASPWELSIDSTTSPRCRILPRSGLSRE